MIGEAGMSCELRVASCESESSLATRNRSCEVGVGNWEREASVATLATRNSQLATSDVHATEGDAVAHPGRSATSLAVLLTSHVLRDGELVLLILRPSLWFIVLTSLRFIAVVLILLCTAIVLDDSRAVVYGSFATLAVAGRIGWAVLQWMNRLYILTDMRILRLSGVFGVEIHDCPLRKINRTYLLRPFKERICRVGTIVIEPQPKTCPPTAWQIVARPLEVHRQVESAIRRARHPGTLAPGIP
jgi:hypothetical protein